ncbi:MAG TPA: hypothetical protein VII60_07050 [Acidimicrobiales bacterium]
MSAVFIQARNRARGNVTAPMIIWSIVMAVVLFIAEAHHGAHRGDYWIGFGATALFGVYLGLRRRVAAAFVAPFVSWMAAWVPLWIAAMVRDGFFKGLAVGLFWITIGWIFIGVLEFVTLFVIGSFVRLLRGSSGTRQGDVIVFGPGGNEG